MKKFVFISMAMIGLMLTVSAGDNLLKKWNPYPQVPSTTKSESKGVLSFKNTAKAINGYRQWIALNQKTIAPIKFGGEVRATNVKGHTSSNFSIYLDVRFKTGKPAWGQQIVLPAGSFDWKKVEKTLKFDRPITSISVNVLFRNVSGEAQFRNLFLEEVK